MKRILSVLLSILIVASTCIVFVSADSIVIDGNLDEDVWTNAVWNTVDKTNGRFQGIYSGNLPDFAFDWAITSDAENLYLAVKVNQEANFGELSQVGSANLRFWVDNDLSDTERSGLYDFTYNGTSCEDTRPTKSSDSVNALTTGEGYTYYEISIKKADLGYDPAKDFGVWLTVSDINLTDTGDAYDALNSGMYVDNALAPWETTAIYHKVELDRTYTGGVNNFSDETQISIDSADLPLLTDGDKLLEAGNWGSFEGAVLITNLVCTDETINPTAKLVLDLEEVKSIDEVVLDFYHCYNVMIGLPKDNKVRLSSSVDGIVFYDIGEFDFEGEAEAGKFGTIDAVFDIKDVDARYIGIKYDFGPSGLETDGKVVWEFTSLTEVGVTETDRTYTVGVNNFSYAPEVVPTKALDVLTDGEIVDDATGFGNDGIVLFNNLVATDKLNHPTVELVLDLGETTFVDQVVLDFYHEYSSMVGLPKNNAVRLSYSNDGIDFFDLGRYTFEGEAVSGELGIIEAVFDVPVVNARYIGIDFDFGPSPFDGKVVWEFIGLTEVGIIEDEITIDGQFDDGIWRDDWIRVDGIDKGKWQALDSNTINTEVDYFYYDYKLVYRDDNLYLGVKFPIAPNWTEPGNDTSFITRATNARFWLAGDVMENPEGSFGALIDLGCDNDGNAIITRGHNINVENCTLAGTSGEDYFYLEFAMPVSELGFEAVEPSDYFAYGISGSDIFPNEETPGYGTLASTDNFVYNDRTTFDRFYFDFLDWKYVAEGAAGAVVSKDKLYEGTIAERTGWTDPDGTKLTDGDVGALAALGGNGPFVGYQVVKTTDYEFKDGGEWVEIDSSYSADEREDGVFSQLIDLGETFEDIFQYSARFGQITTYGILFPDEVNFYASEDGINWYYMGQAVQGETEILEGSVIKAWADYTYTSDVGVKARYIRIDITPVDPVTTPPEIEGDEELGATITVTKTCVTAVSEISVYMVAEDAEVVYGEDAPNTDGYGVNVALNKDWFGTDSDYTTDPNYTGSDYSGDFTDGVYVTGQNFSYGSPWFAFYRNGDLGNIDSNKYGEVIVDLDEDGTGLGAVRMQVAPEFGGATLTVYASNNAYVWDEVGTLTYDGTDIQWIECIFEKEIDARYIKVGVQVDEMFFMVSELEVIKYYSGVEFSIDFANQYAVGYQDPSTWLYNGGEELAGVGDANYIYTPEYGSTLGEAASTGIAWWDIFVIDFDLENEYYYIDAFYPSSGENKAHIAIPENGFIIASSGNGRNAVDGILRTDIAIGAPVYVYDINIQTLGVEDTMEFVDTNVISVFAPIEGKEEFIPDFFDPLPEDAFAIDNFAGYVAGQTTIITRVGEAITAGAVSELCSGTVKDYNYFYMAVVDANNEVIAINHTIGRPQGKKDDVEIPEGGYLLLCYAGASQPQATDFLEIAVGDTITLYNVDLEALAAAQEVATLVGAGFTVEVGGYETGVNDLSDPALVGRIGDDLAVLTDGDKLSDAGAWSAVTGGVVGFKNLVCTDETQNPLVDLVLKLDEVTTFNQVVIDFYQDYNVMIGLPRDNEVRLSYSVDGVTFTDLGTFTFEGESVDGAPGVIEAIFDIDQVDAQYVGIEFNFGPSPFPEPEPKVVWEFIGMTEVGVFAFSDRTYEIGVNDFSDETQVGRIGSGLDALTDGDKLLDAGAWTVDGVVGFKNLVCTDETQNPLVDLVLMLDEVTTFNQVVIDFYQDYNVMIGLPRDNEVRLSYSVDGVTFTDLGTFTFEGESVYGAPGVIEAIFDIDQVDAQYVGIEFNFGPSPFPEPEPKVVWEFIGMTEVGVTLGDKYEPGENDIPIGIINRYWLPAELTDQGYAVGEVANIFTTPGKTVSELCDDQKNHSWWYMGIFEWDDTAEAYILTELITEVGTDTQDAKGALVVPENGFIVATNSGMNAHNDAHTLFGSLLIGTKAQLNGYYADQVLTEISKDTVLLGKLYVTIQEETPPEPFELIDDSVLEIQGDYLLGITDTMTIDDIKAQFKGEVTVSGFGTGNTITAGDEELTMIILGDLNGDGELDAKDYLLLKRGIIGQSYTLDEIEILASLISSEDEPKAADYLLLKRHIIGTHNIFD